MSFLNKIHILSQKTEKLRFKIVLTVFLLVLLSTGIFAWIWYLKTAYSTNVIVLEPVKRSVKQAEISPEIKKFGVKIDKIKVLTPVIENVDGANKNVYYKALEKGVAHYRGTSLPSKGSNIFIFGHSSSIFGRGEYDKVFARLGELTRDDKIIVFYQDKEYEYYVFEKKVVEKTEVSVLAPTKKEQLTLMTCWPIGSNEKRLIIKAAPIRQGDSP